MARPRAQNKHLPAYCYRDKRGALYMLVPGQDGKRQRRTYGTDLHRMLADWADLYGAGEKSSPLMGPAFDLLLGHLARKRARKEISVSTEEDYQKQIGSLRRVWAAVRWADFDAAALEKWQAVRGEQSVVQCNRELTVLNMLAKLAGRKGLLKDNPVRFIERLKERPRERYVTDAEFAAVFEKALPVVRAAMFIASITGLRQGDILRLKRASFTEAGLLVPTRKTNQPLLFAWTDGLRQAFEMGNSVREFTPLNWLATEEGKAYTSSGFRTLWQRAINDAQGLVMDPKTQRWSLPAGHALKFERFTFNDLRAKAGSESRDWKMLGHLDERTFQRIYNRLPRKVEPTR